GAHAGDVEGFLDVLFVSDPAPESGHLLGCVRERDAPPRFVEAGEARGSSPAPEGGARSLRAAMRRPNVVRAERHEEPAAQVVAEDDSLQHVEARTAVALGYGQGGGDDCTAGVRLGD